MSSSIFSSEALSGARPAVIRRTKRARGAWTAAMVVLAVLGLVEAGARLGGLDGSAEVRYLRALPARAERLARADGLRVLMLGNSYTHQGFDPGVFQAELDAEAAPPLQLEVMALDGAHIVEWYRLLRREFLERGRGPDVLLVNVQECLRDQSETALDRLTWQVAARDLPAVLSEDMDTFGQRAEFMQSWLFASYAARARVRLRVMDTLIPDYRAVKKDIRRRLKEAVSPPGAVAAASAGAPAGTVAGAPAGTPAGATTSTYRHLEQLLDETKARHIEAIFVAMPSLEPYPVDPVAVRAIEAHGMSWLDLRGIAGLDASSFADTRHLNAAGKPVFSRELARALLERYPEKFRSSPLGPTGRRESVVSGAGRTG